MTTITLESIKAEQTKLAFMINELEAQTAAGNAPWAAHRRKRK